MSKMDEGLAKLYAGDFNDLSQDVQADGSIIVTLSKRGDGVAYRFRIENLYGENERVLEKSKIEPILEPWIKRRQDQAKRQRGGN